MSLMEDIEAELEPGPIGELVEEEPPRDPRPRWHMIVRAVLGLVMVVTPLVVAFVMAPFSVTRVIVVVTALSTYLVLAHYLRPSPDWSNMGWMGGALDNPFRISDDANRVLLFLSIVLWPGRFATTAILDLFRPPPTVEE